MAVADKQVEDIYSSAHHDLGIAQILSLVKGSKIVKRCNGWLEKMEQCLIIESSNTNTTDCCHCTPSWLEPFCNVSYHHTIAHKLHTSYTFSSWADGTSYDKDDETFRNIN
ncbi:hypothetical protein Dsin_017923 [Dipteronia sinensis]|uniref:Uncharacterized protein n=1 Tax=Dipteronia sinensis TaxID=43782 RepID=A0AAE0E760_9ROSI|nr:hypothetical protein Dsin_017923 [Dipteronia sinensis]